MASTCCARAAFCGDPCALAVASLNTAKHQRDKQQKSRTQKSRTLNCCFHARNHNPSCPFFLRFLVPRRCLRQPNAGLTGWSCFIQLKSRKRRHVVAHLVRGGDTSAFKRVKYSSSNVIFR